MDPNIKKLVQQVSFFLEYAQRFMEDFERRYATIYQHNKTVTLLMNACRDKRMDLILDLVIKIKKNVLAEFESLKDYPDTRAEQLFESEKRTLQALRGTNKYLHNDLIQALRSLKSLRSKVGDERIRKVLSGFKVEEGRVAEAERVLDYILELFNRWRYILLTLKSEIIREKQLADELISDITEATVDAEGVMRKLNVLKNIVDNINMELVREKNEFVIPMGSFFKEEHSLHQRLQLLLQGISEGEITVHDIKKDIRKMSTSQEVVSYCSSMLQLLALHLEKDTANKQKLIKYLGKVSKEASKDLLGKLQKRAYKQAQANIDYLTGGTIKGVFMPIVQTLLSITQRETRGFAAVIMYDVDKFKEFNDIYGHQVGDEVLSFVGKLIKKTMRGGDLFVRYGGEELLVFVPFDKRMKGTEHLAERIRKEIEKASVKKMKEINAKNNIPSFKKRHNITISGGVAFFKANKKSPPPGIFLSIRDRLIKKADEALYTSKGAGRNRVTLDKVPIYI